MDLTQPDWLNNRAAHFERISARYYSISDGLEKWILASYVSLNGAGIIALFSAQMIDDRPRYWIFVWLSCGLISALLQAHLNVGVLNRGALAIEQHVGEIHRSIIFGDPYSEKPFLERMEFLKIGASIYRYAQYLPLACLNVAIGIAGAELN